MRTLILTYNTGEGHNSSAYALKEIYEKNNEYVVIVDALNFMSRNFSTFVGKGHATLYRRMPRLFNKGYAISEKHDYIFSEGGFLYRFLSYGENRLFCFLKENNIDNVICCHPFSGIMVSDLCKKFGFNIRTSIVATDYTCAPSTNSTNLDLYFIPHKDLISEFVENGIPSEKLFVSGIPIKQCFYEEYSKIDSRHKLNLPGNKKIIVMCCGSMGCGPMESMSRELSNRIDKDTLLIIICGRNKRLYKRMSKIQSDKIMVVGFTKDMCDYIRSSDVFLTKAGGISVTEAAYLRTPMVFINAVAGCELRNREFFFRHDCGVSVSNNEMLVKETIKLLQNEKRRSELSEHMRSEFYTNSAQSIYAILNGKPLE